MGQYISSPVIHGETQEADNDLASNIITSTKALPSPLVARPLLTKAEGHYLYLENGQRIIDGCGGAAVACIGHGRKDVAKAIAAQANRLSYVSWAHFESQPAKDLSDWLSKSTGGRLPKAYIMCSGIVQPSFFPLLYFLYHRLRSLPRLLCIRTHD